MASSRFSIAGSLDDVAFLHILGSVLGVCGGDNICECLDLGEPPTRPLGSDMVRLPVEPFDLCTDAQRLRFPVCSSREEHDLPRHMFLGVFFVGATANREATIKCKGHGFLGLKGAHSLSVVNG